MGSVKNSPLLFSVMLALLSACSPGQAASQPTAMLPVSSATVAPIPTVTQTLVPTLIPSPTPVPLAGRLLIVVNNELRQLSADGSSDQVILAKQQFETRFPAIGGKDGVAYRSAILSPDGEKILVVTCSQFSRFCDNKRLYLSSLDLSDTLTIQSYSGGLLEWSPTSKLVMLQAETDARIKTVISAAKDSYGKINSLPGSQAAFWSFDGSKIYYYDQKAWYVVNSDGSQKTTLKSDICANAPDPSSYALAQSPNGQKIAIGYMDGTVIIASTDLVSYKFGLLGGYVNKLFWSPDSTKLAVDIRTSTNQSDVYILNRDGMVLNKLRHPEGAKFLNTCGWSPDGLNIDFLGLGDSGNDLYLQPVIQSEAILRLSLPEVNSSCPVWLP